MNKEALQDVCELVICTRCEWRVEEKGDYFYVWTSFEGDRLARGWVEPVKKDEDLEKVAERLAKISDYLTDGVLILD
jgi:hypothetical protein